MEFKFYSGEDKRLKVQLTKMSCDVKQPYSIPLNATVTIILPASPNDLELNATITNYDLGKIYVDLNDTQTATMISGDLIVKIVSGSTTRYAKITNAIRKVSL